MSVDVVGVTAAQAELATKVFAAELSLYSNVLDHCSTPAGLSFIIADPVEVWVPIAYKLLLSVVTSVISLVSPIIFCHCISPALEIERTKPLLVAAS